MNITKFSVRSLTLAVLLTGASASASVFDTVTSIGSGLLNHKGTIALAVAGGVAVKAYRTGWFGSLKKGGIAFLGAVQEDRAAIAKAAKTKEDDEASKKTKAVEGIDTERAKTDSQKNKKPAKDGGCLTQ